MLWAVATKRTVARSLSGHCASASFTRCAEASIKRGVIVEHANLIHCRRAFTDFRLRRRNVLAILPAARI